MNSIGKHYDASPELGIQRFHQGIKLVRPQAMPESGYICSISEMFDLPFSSYFLDSNSIISNINESAALVCGWDSTKQAIGSHVGKIADKKTDRLVKAHDRSVLLTKTMLICDEPITRTDGFVFDEISLKYPWYDSNNQVIGVFGLSIVIGEKSQTTMSQALYHLMKTGLLSNHAYLFQSKVDVTFRLTKRQSECLHYLSKGLSLKQIGRVLGLSHRTIEHYIEAIKIKMKCHSRDEILEKYWQQN